MDEFRYTEPPLDRRVTWGFTLVVIVVAILTSAIVIGVTRPRMRNELVPLSATATLRPTQVGTAAFQAAPAVEGTPIPTIESVWTPVPIVATFTPRSKAKGYVRWLYWYVRPNSVKLGECVQITWETENATSLQLFRDRKLILDSALAAHTYEDCPVQAGYTVYRMVGVNQNGESNWIQLQVRVRAP